MKDEDGMLISLGLGGMGVGVAILVTKIGKELAIATSNASYLMLQNTYQLAYNYIPSNATDIQYMLNATYLNSLSNLQQTTNSIVQTYNIIEYLLYIYFIS